MEQQNAVNILTVIPVYNHAQTVRAVAEGCLRFSPRVLAADDGSTDNPREALKGLPVDVLRFEKNRGKGAVVLDAARWAKERGFTHILTIDADGQHFPSDIPSLARAAEQNPRALIIGKRRFEGPNVPGSSKFGRRFSAFWIHLQTGQAVSDIQSGLRCYPVEILLELPCWCRRYSFEVEVVAKAVWAGFAVLETEVSVFYPKREERISHFKAFKDNLRISALNTYLTIRSMIPLPHRQYCVTDSKITKRGYWEAIVLNLKQRGSVSRNALSAAWGVFCGSIALPGVRQGMLFIGAGWWNLNKILSISFEKLCIGPVIPALCIEAGFFMRHGHFLTEFNLTTLGRQFLSRVWEWVLGSLVVAPLLAALVFCAVWCAGYALHRGMTHGK